jgi:hypothetical protein
MVLEMKQDGRNKPFGKREAHPAHLWWYTTYGGGHQLNDISHPETDWDDTERRYVTRWLCLGRDHYGV